MRRGDTPAGAECRPAAPSTPAERVPTGGRSSRRMSGARRPSILRCVGDINALPVRTALGCRSSRVARDGPEWRPGTRMRRSTMPASTTTDPSTAAVADATGPRSARSSETTAVSGNDTGSRVAMTPAAALARHLEWLEFALAAARSEETWRAARLTRATKKSRDKRTLRLAEVRDEIAELSALVSAIRGLQPRRGRPPGSKNKKPAAPRGRPRTAAGSGGGGAGVTTPAAASGAAPSAGASTGAAAAKPATPKQRATRRPATTKRTTAAKPTRSRTASSAATPRRRRASGPSADGAA